MSSLPRYAVNLALIFICAVFPLAADSQTTTSKKAETNSVSGRVSIRGKGVAGIIVSIRNSGFSPQPGPAFKATTDQDGNYRISDIPAGNYQVLPIAPTYVSPEPFSSRGRGKMLMLA